jgi:hypothetical protein
MLVYNTATSGTGTNSVSPGFYYNDGAKWVKVSSAAEGDPTKDAWIDDNANTQVKLGTLSNGATARPDTAAVVVKDNGRMGIGLINPAGILDIKGKMYVNNKQTVYNASALDSAKFYGSLFIGNGGNYLSSASGSTFQARHNTGIGIQSLASNTSGAENTAVGSHSLKENTTGTDNTAMGAGSLLNNTTGGWNSAFGGAALRGNTTGSFNSAFGFYAMENGLSTGTLTGRYNTAVGYRSLAQITTGSYNTVLGSTDSLNVGPIQRVSTGSYNTFVGYRSGDGITTGDGNTVLGARVGSLPAALSNNIILADGAGNQRIRVLDNGNAGIGETAPSAKLEVNGNVEIRNVDAIGNDIQYKPLIWNSVTNRVETTPNNGNNINKKITIAPGVTATVYTLTVTGSGAYDVKVLGYNACGATTYNKFILAGQSTTYWTINHIGGTSENGASTVDAASTKTSKYIHNPLTVGCADGGNSTALDYTISVNGSTGEVSVKNNGNISRDYYVVIEKAFD